MIVLDNKKNEIRVGDLVRSNFLYYAGIVLSASASQGYIAMASGRRRPICSVYWFKMDKVIGVPADLLLLLPGPRNDD